MGASEDAVPVGEPTTGLRFHDKRQLPIVLHPLTDVDNKVILVNFFSELNAHLRLPASFNLKAASIT